MCEHGLCLVKLSLTNPLANAFWLTEVFWFSLGLLLLTASLLCVFGKKKREGLKQKLSKKAANKSLESQIPIVFCCKCNVCGDV